MGTNGNSEVVDLAALQSRCLGNMALVERVIKKFRETGAADLNHLEDALKRTDLERVVEISHRFKGASSNISALRLHELSARTERLGRESNIAELGQVLPQMRTEWEKFVRYSETLLKPVTVA